LHTKASDDAIAANANCVVKSHKVQTDKLTLCK